MNALEIAGIVVGGLVGLAILSYALWVVAVLVVVKMFTGWFR